MSALQLYAIITTLLALIGWGLIAYMAVQILTMPTAGDDRVEW